VILAQLAHFASHTVSSLALFQEEPVGFSLPQLWANMGWLVRCVVIVLFIESIWSLAVMIDRYLYFSAARKQSREFAPKVAGALKDSKLEEAIKIADRNKKSHLAEVVTAGLQEFRSSGGTATDETIASSGRALERAEAIVAAVKKAIGKTPLSIKTRLGWNKENEILKFAPRLEAAGADAISIHGRTKTQGYSGKANWEMIGKVKKLVSIPVIANGDIVSLEDVDKCLQITGADGVMIGRGAIGNPWIFGEFAALLRGEPLPAPPSIHEQRHALLEHFGMAVEVYGEALASRQMRKIGIKYSKLHPNGPAVWREFIAVKNQKDWEAVLARHYQLDGPGIRVGSVADAEDVCKVSCEPNDSQSEF